MIPPTRASYPRTDAPAERAIYDAMLDNIGIQRLVRPIFSAALADRMFAGLNVTAMHHENAMEYLYCEVVSPDDGRKYVVRIYPPKD